MQLNGKEDLRVQKSINAIRRAFEELICEKDYEKITVTELTERAQINKKTFYRYYPALDDLLSELQLDYCSRYIKKIEKFRLPEDFDKVSETFFRFSAAQTPAYEKISCHTNYSQISQEMIDRVMTTMWNKSEKFRKLPAEKQNILINYIQSGNAAMYRQWVADGKKVPVEELIRMSNDLMCPGMDKYFGSLG